MKKYVAYIRVSTQKQGQTGVSLQEQRAAIEHYAEIQPPPDTKPVCPSGETAAKRGHLGREMLDQARAQ